MLGGLGKLEIVDLVRLPNVLAVLLQKSCINW